MLLTQSQYLLIRHQEIALKGKNRPFFEKMLCHHLSKCLSTHGEIKKMSGRMIVSFKPEVLSNKILNLELIKNLSQISGVFAVTPCSITEPSMPHITQATLAWIKSAIEVCPQAKTFAIRTRRVNKQFPLSSTQVDSLVGAEIKKIKNDFIVHLKRPDLKIAIEIRQKHALIYSGEQTGVKGLPMDARQRVVCLLSGGIDSPVAAYELMRRGCTPILVHFHSQPFTSEASISKVKRLTKILRNFSSFPLELWLVPLLPIQKAVRNFCNERYRTIHYRRFMMMIAQELAMRRGAKALVTGDAIGQVASQTLTNLQAIEEVTKLPVFRPLIALDKDQIIAKAKWLGSYEISVEPHEDSCVLFAPLHPATQAKLSTLLEEQEMLPTYQLVFEALDMAEKIIISS